MQYLTNEQGDRVGVLLDWATYEQLRSPLAAGPDCLLNLAAADLIALAESQLAPAAQEQLSQLLAKNQAADLTAAESEELDRLLDQIDRLTVLKARALQLDVLARVAPLSMSSFGGVATDGTRAVWQLLRLLSHRRSPDHSSV